MADPFTLSFGIKAVQEYLHDGQAGLLLCGYATRFGEVDRSGEHMTPAALSDLEDTWAAEAAPLVLFEHGLSELGARRIGKAIEHRIDEQGLHVSVFVPKEPRWKDGAALRKFRQVYRALRDGLVRGFSVGGTYTRDAAGAIKRWSTLELSITARPCLPSATFTVGAKAIGEAYGALPPILDDDHEAHDGDQPPKGGPVSFVNAPQPHSNAGPSSVPLAVPSGNVTVSAPVGATEGAAWTLSYAAGGNTLTSDAGTKAVTKKEGDGARHPPSHYLVVEDETKPSTWHLQVKNETGAYDRKLCAQAYAALHSNFRGNPYGGPNKRAALAKLRQIYKSQGWDWPADQESSSGKKAELVRAGLAELERFTVGSKQGRQHSAATLAAVKAAIDLLEQHFGLADADDEQEPDEAQSNART